MPPTEALLAVIEVARATSISEAALEMGLTHGTVSRRVKMVEDWLGAELFERHGRGVRINPVGQRFVREVEETLSTIERSAQRWKPRPGPQIVRISALPSFARLWLVPNLSALIGDPVDLAVELVLEHQMADFSSGKIDLAIRYGRGGWPGIDSELLFEEHLTPVASPQLARSLGRNPSAADLLDHAIIHDSDAAGWRMWLAEAGADYRARPLDHRFEDYDMVLDVAAQGLGVALGRLPFAQSMIDDGRLVRLHDASLQSRMSHYVVTPQRRRRQSVERFLGRMRHVASISAVPPPSRR